MMTGKIQWRAGVGRQRNKKVREAGERGTGSGRLSPPCLPTTGKSQRAGSLQLWRFCCCVWSARIVFNRSRVCERSFLSFSVSRFFSAYNLWKLPANMAERFVTFDIREVQKFIDNEENSNTRKKTKNVMALLSSFMAKEKENRQVEEIPPQQLDNYLSRFLLSVRKKNGDE